MSIDHELAIVRYLLESLGDVDAINVAKKVDIDHFQSEACANALRVIKQCLSQGFWPSKQNITDALDSSTSTALQNAIAGSKLVINANDCLMAIRREWEHNRQVNILAKSYHALKRGESSIDEIIRSLESTRIKTDGWQYRNFSEVIEDVRAGRPLDVSMQERNLLVTGLPSFDKALCAPPGSYSFLAGLPGTGKTSVLFAFAALSAIAGTKTLALSLETPRSTLEAKSAASFLSSQGLTYFVGSILKKGNNKVPHNLNVDNVSNLDIGFHPAGLRWEELEAIIRNRASYGCRLFMIDYFGLLEPPNMSNHEHEYTLAAKMSKGAKMLCSELNIHICFVAQPNGEVKYGERPDPTKLGATKQLQRDADFGFFLWVDEKRNATFQQNNGEQYRLIKAWLHKNRLFNDDAPIKTDPEIWIKAELRRNHFEEISEPMDVNPDHIRDRI